MGDECGKLLWARQVSDTYSPDQDLISWPSIIARVAGLYSLCAKMKKKQVLTPAAQSLYRGDGS